jgi:hypothetical protein
MEKLPQSVLKRLQGTPPESHSHPDPDLLTALAENSLLDQERAPIIDHLAQCKDCRDILAIATSAADLPTRAKILPGAVFAPRPWLLWPAFRWAGLAAGVLIVASVGILQYGHNRQTTQVASTALPDQTSLSSPSRPSASSVPVEESPPQNALHNDGVDALNAPAAARRTDVRNAPKSEPEAGIQRQSGAVTAQASAAPRAVGVPAAETLLARNQPAVPLSAQGMSPDVVKAKNPVPFEPGAVSPAPPPHSLQTVSPGNFRWAINGGVLQRSEDEGRNWQSVNPNPNSPAEFLAIAVNGMEVWVGGSASSLYHSADAGTHWTAVAPSARGTSLTGNVIGIQFSDPQHGKITTSHSETWVTSDAGETWAKQQ